MATTKKTPAPKKATAPKKAATKKVAKKKEWVPKKMDETLTLATIGAEIGDEVMLGPGMHIIVGFDATREDQVQLKPTEPGTSGTVRRGLYTVSLNLVKNKK